ncbi:MAG: hypothetical protein SA339_02515 [Methanomassiliicoccus sp.]|nr:hypothetical protein [Methanomassiliicoccus sp.]
MASACSSAMDSFLIEVQKVGLLGRLFSWGRIRKLSYEASNEYALLKSQRDGASQQVASLNLLLESAKKESETSNREVIRISNELAKSQASLEEIRSILNDRVMRIKELEAGVSGNLNQIAEQRAQIVKLLRQIEDKNAEITVYEGKLAEAATARDSISVRVKELETELSSSKNKLDELTSALAERDKRITQFESVQEARKEEHIQKLAEVQGFMGTLKEDKARLEKEREDEIAYRFEEMKQTWLNHERRVEETLKALCQRHTIEYLGKDKVPFKGKPDNTLKICEEFVVFDAKSPQGDDLSNFPDYVKKQSGEVQKYVKEKDVKKDVYLVVPTNTIDLFEEHTFNHGDFKVFVVTIDSLEPIILSLKKIEEYEFLEQLSPEERDDICRVLGRFSHLTKRRIQVDSFFCNEAFKALKECDCLPEDMALKVEEYEKATLLNPNREDRKKLISEKVLQKAVEEVKKDSDFLDLDTSEEVCGGIAEMPLMKEKRVER